MQELVGRITSLDPEATQGLKVIAYFDALIDGHAGIEVLLRGAALLAGCPAGFSRTSEVPFNGSVSQKVTSMRVKPTGERAEDTGAPVAGSLYEHAVAGGARVWLEREGPAHASDSIILERLALGVGIRLEKTLPAATPGRSLEVLLDPDASAQEHAAAAARLKLDPRGVVRIVAQPTGPQAVGMHNLVMVTGIGPIRAVLHPHQPETTTLRRAGVGIPAVPAELSRSWASALLALRLTSVAEPVVDAEQLGSILVLAEAADARPTPHPDQVVIEGIVSSDPALLTMIEAIVSTESVRAAAAVAGVHHSTMQARSVALIHRLGFDFRTPAGRVRLTLAVALYRLGNTRFD